ncbi:hypothetical protein ACQYWY_20435 [Comamonas sediminis]|uniref:hypothetical protein n=1 Tax=Comamonas sediminis TaxID=1783360 RepID=UPI003D2BEDBC
MQNQQYEFWTYPPESDPQVDQQTLLIQVRPGRSSQLISPEELKRLYEDLAPDVPY